jgi:hypothetical protein
MKAIKCQCCGKLITLNNNSIIKQVNTNTDVVLLSLVNQYATYSELYDKEKLSVLMQVKRKLINYSLKQNLTNSRKTPVK